MEYPKHHKKETLEEVSKQEELNEEINKEKAAGFIENFLQVNPLNEEALYIKELLVDDRIYSLQRRTLAVIRDSFDPESALKPKKLEEALLTELDLADTAHMPRSLPTSYDNLFWGVEPPGDLWRQYLIYGNENNVSQQQSAQQTVKQQMSLIKREMKERVGLEQNKPTETKLKEKRSWIKKLENSLLSLVIAQKICKKFDLGENMMKTAYQIGMELFEDGIKTVNETREEESTRLSGILREKVAGFYEVKEEGRSYPFFVDDKKRFMEEKDDSKFLEGKEDVESISYIKYLDDELLFYVSKGLLKKHIGNEEEARNSFEKVIGLYTDATKKLSPGAKKFLATEKFNRTVRDLHREIGTSYFNLGLAAVKKDRSKDEYDRYFRKAEQSYLIYGDSNTYIPGIFRIYDIYERIKDYA